MANYSDPSTLLDMSDPQNSFFSPDVTFAFDKYSCVREFYYIHAFFAYLIMFSGFGAIITRLWAPIKWMHLWFGKTYIVAMLAGTFTSLLIHNTGLPLGVMVSFGWVFSGLTVGWYVIGLHQSSIAKQALENLDRALQRQFGVHESKSAAATVSSCNATTTTTTTTTTASATTISNSNLNSSNSSGEDKEGDDEHSSASSSDVVAEVHAGVGEGSLNLHQRFEAEKGNVIASRTPFQRLFSYKTLHGTAMIISFYNIVGRVFVTKLTSDFTCHTYPVYKPIKAVEFDGVDKPLTLVPIHDSNYGRTPWAYSEGRWAAICFFAPLLISVVCAVVYSYVIVPYMNRRSSSSGSLLASCKLKSGKQYAAIN